MKHVYTIATFLLSLVLYSCQSTSDLAYQSTPLSSLYLDEQFLLPSSWKVETEQEIFMLDDAMTEMVEKKLMATNSTQKKARLLLKHIFSQDNIALSYASDANVTARDAFHSKTANCLSLTIMAYALAEKAGLNISFQQVDIPEYWVRNGLYNLLTGHVNLVIHSQPDPKKNIIFGTDAMQIDFDPFVVKQSFPKRVIEKNTVLAMFYNNKGGQSLVVGDYSLAYQYLKAATQADQLFSPAWGNLAVLYKLTNNMDIAEQTYRHAISLNANNLTALANLAILLRSQGQYVEADTIESKLHLKRSKNPYYQAVLADEAAYRKDYVQALIHYKKALRLDNSIHELYFGLAKVYYQVGNIASAKKMMRKAIKLNKTKSTEYQYIAKLNFLNAEQVN
ncbi:MAG: tetratricopeptide repeat protein [Colwellia sp.]|nr:tetratricopeptide repeat protein [Colwellia sp.]MCW8863432.1 tetratricopeptide repeat protein [Colwellia sp.]MCW9081428.1 tetratricopeptide repeat protein [Colwellia sp.]